MTVACDMTSATMLEGPNVRHSVLIEGREEAERHKWIESEKAGRDLGDSAISSWVRQHWNGFLCARWLEHLDGLAFWIELDHDDFGLLRRAFQDSPIFGEILWNLKLGSENLDIILLAREEHWCMEEVLAILEALDVNSRRIEFQLESRLVQGH